MSTSDPSFESSRVPTEKDRSAAALSVRLRARDPAAFEEIVRGFTPRLLVAARRVLGCEDEARDAVQEGFLAAFQAIESFKGDAQISTWLHRIVINCALMRLRRRKRKPESPIEDLLPAYLPDGHQETPPGHWRPADEIFDERSRRQLVRRMIDELPETHRTVLILRDIEELNTREVAVALEISDNAVKIRLHRARQALRSLLEPHLTAA